jgi:hypothetical protein
MRKVKVDELRILYEESRGNQLYKLSSQSGLLKRSREGIPVSSTWNLPAKGQGRWGKGVSGNT